MTEKQNNFPKGITEEVLEGVYPQSEWVLRMYSSMITAHHDNGNVDLIWSDDVGFNRCPLEIYKELVKRSLAPEIRTSKVDYKSISTKVKGLIKDEVCLGTYGLVELALREGLNPDNKTSYRNIESLTEEEWKSVFEAGEKDITDYIDKIIRSDNGVYGVNTRSEETICSYSFLAKSFSNNDFNQYAAFKRLEELGVSL